LLLLLLSLGWLWREGRPENWYILPLLGLRFAAAAAGVARGNKKHILTLTHTQKLTQSDKIN